MADIRSQFDVTALAADWMLVSSGLDVSRDLETAVILSLFTDARAGPDDKLPQGSDARGWWADWQGEEIHGVARVGSRLWLLAREKQTEEVRLRAEFYAREALQWLLDQKVADSLSLSARWVRTGVLALDIKIVRQGATHEIQPFEWAWDQI